jgi:hypothetical protein
VGFGRKALQRFEPRPPAPLVRGASDKVSYRGHEIIVGPTEKKSVWEAAMFLPVGAWRKTTYVYVHGKSREQALCVARARIDRVLCRE